MISILKVNMYYRPHLCMHRDDAPCMASCSVEGALYKWEDGLVIIDPVKCTGCKNCVDSCPYNAIYFNEDLNIAPKCTSCVHLIDEDWKEPRYVDACPAGAITFGEESDLKDAISRAKILSAESKIKPRVYYRNIPKKFIAGTVYDPQDKKVVIGATFTLDSNGNKHTAATDGFGDFWFEGLEIGNYSLKIKAQGFATKAIDDINTEKNVNLGDIPLQK